MIMMPSRTTLSRVLARSSQLLSVVRNKITFIPHEDKPDPHGRVNNVSTSTTLLLAETEVHETDAGDIRASVPVSLEVLAEQMLSIVEIVSAQEKAIQSLKQRCQKLEEHNQAIMVAFTTFFHVLAAGRVAKIEEISAILEDITTIAEREERPQDAIRFLRDLAAMLGESPSEGAESAWAEEPKSFD
jgi:hypothetical protein